MLWRHYDRWVEEIFLDKFKGFLVLIIPCMWFILPKEFEDGLTSRGEHGNESTNVL